MSQGKPHEIRLGKLKALIHTNEGKDGPWHSVGLVRVYRDESGAERHAATLGRDDLLPAGLLLGKAFDWVCRQQKILSGDTE